MLEAKNKIVVTQNKPDTVEEEAAFIERFRALLEQLEEAGVGQEKENR